MTGEGILALYWSARAESLEACAARVATTLGSLCIVGFSTFRRRGRTRREAQRAILAPTPEQMTILLANGTNRRDLDSVPIPELGWSPDLWSGGADSENFSFSVNCGCFSDWVGNNLLVKFPRSGPMVLAKQLMPARELFSTLVDLWDPEQATLCEGAIDWSAGALSPRGAVYELKQGSRAPPSSNR